MAARRGTLLVIDVQQAFDDPSWGTRNNLDAEANIARLLASWRATGEPVVHVRHVNEGGIGRFARHGRGFQPKPDAREQEGEPVVLKTVNSAFIGTNLAELLTATGGKVICVGLTTDHCVSTTVRMAANYGYTTTIVSDATATFERTGPDGQHWSAETMHSSALASLHDEFATVLTTEQLLAEEPT